MNKIELVGRTTNDIELKTAGETKFCAFQIAVRRNFKNKQTNQYDSDFLPCIVSGGAAETFAKYVKKGDQIAIVGSLRSKQITEDSGEKKTFYSIAVDDFMFLEKKPEASAPATAVDDLPFEVV